MSFWLTPSAIVRLIASGFSSRGNAGDEKKASRAALVVHSLSAGGQILDQLARADGLGDLVLGAEPVEDQFRQRARRAGMDQAEVDRLERVVLDEPNDVFVRSPDRLLEIPGGLLGVGVELLPLAVVESLVSLCVSADVFTREQLPGLLLAARAGFGDREEESALEGPSGLAILADDLFEESHELPGRREPGRGP